MAGKRVQKGNAIGRVREVAWDAKTHSFVLLVELPAKGDYSSIVIWDSTEVRIVHE